MLARLTGRIKSCPFLLAVAAVVGLSRAFSPIPVYAPSCNQRGVMRSRNSFLGSPFLQQGKNCHFQRCSSKLSMMFDQLTEKMAGVAQLLQGKKTISTASVEGALKDVKRALLDADVNLGVTNRLVEAVKEKAVGMEVTEGVTPEQQFIKVMYDQLVEVMGSAASPLARRSDDNPTVILLAGLQGTGKTTAAAKLAKYLEEGKEPRSVLLVAGDIYRPAAIDQLQTLGQQIEVEVFSMGQDVDPVDITNAGIAYAKEKGYDTVIVDTAGRQVVDEDLMTELKNIQVASNPDEVLLVVDAMTGQEAATLTSVFNQKIGITGAVLTKLDGDTRGGSALSVQGVSGKPIKFVGVGEKMDELEPFYPDRMASRILGMGDVVSLVEKAEKQMSEKEAERMAKKMMDETFDFEDFIRQSKMIKSMGNMAGVAKMIPGMAGKISQAKLDGAEERLKRAEALIASMTEAERKDPDLLTLDPTAPSRLRRISKGAGLRIKDASDFISEFQQMRTIMSRMGKQMQGQNGGNMFDPASMMGGGNQMANENGVALGNRQQRRTSKKTKGKNGNGGLVKGFSKR
ncbi:unnamed protein product [Discosporangium mesarthrocarpum]